MRAGAVKCQNCTTINLYKRYPLWSVSQCGNLLEARMKNSLFNLEKSGQKNTGSYRPGNKREL
ncbi:hypothetical protein J2Z21_006342 [Streptomyces griseochromogenes]|uniref:Transposase n=1 Tax=Streptomyces griseochromogenes TaxID=68214 RepID=A0ABS4M114_9ACTN|nr:hypothetical protein [Streptomyces griseochromogenes]